LKNSEPEINSGFSSNKLTNDVPLRQFPKLAAKNNLPSVVQTARARLSKRGEDAARRAIKTRLLFFTDIKD